MHANPGHIQQSYRGLQQWRRDALEDFLECRTRTTLEMRKSERVSQHIGQYDDNSQEKENEMVRPRDKIRWAFENRPPRNSAGEKETRKTTNEMGRQHR